MTAAPVHPNHPDPPAVLSDLADPILAITIQLVAASSLWNPQAILQPLNALPRSAAPLATKSALVQMPAVTLDTAAKLGDVGLLRFMHAWSKKWDGRPLEYGPIGLAANAMQVGSVDVLDWWLDESGVHLNWDWEDTQIQNALTGEHGFRFLEWWARRGYPFLEYISFPAVLLAASGSGRVDVLKWLLAHVPADKMTQYSGKSSRKDAVEAAAENGHVPVLDFWVAQGDAGMIPRPDFTRSFSAAVKGNQVGVLQWLESHPQVLAAVQRKWRDSQAPDRGGEREYILADAVTHGLLDWMVKFGLEPYEREYLDASLNACKGGDLSTVERLKALGYWKESRLQLLDAAAGSGNLGLLDWIQSNTVAPPASAPKAKNPGLEFGLFFGSTKRDPFNTACAKGLCRVLEWLQKNGFEMDDPDIAFERAIAGGHLDVLDWLFEHVPNAHQMVTVDKLDDFLASASRHGCIQVLDWLKKKSLKDAGHQTIEALSLRSVQEATDALQLDVLKWWEHLLDPQGAGAQGSGFASYSVVSWKSDTNMFEAAFEKGRTDIIQWWLHKPGPLKSNGGLGAPYLAALYRTDNVALRMARLEALKVWFGAKQPMDYARCIHEASIHGLVEVLDWLHKNVRAPAEAFVHAWTSKTYFGDWEEMHYEGYDRFNHGESLLWWRANMPHVCQELKVNRGDYYNPIHVFILEYVLKSSPGLYCVHWPHLMTKLGNLATMAYLHQQGIDEDLYRTQCEESLLIASQRNWCHVLEWWKSESGQEIKLPLDVLEHRHEVARQAKLWWMASGLVEHDVEIKASDHPDEEGIGATSALLGPAFAVAENLTQGCETQ